ncbi:Extracellular metalloprotease 1 OS=Coccidioides posadasii (strain C735) GN=MEP1 PE=1 SV=1 [Rhizoctonia solani AG-1 IB]|uniref:Extracellular metalloprotease 1 n=1 Tax=Thanatephorus cucumeris (strain AG1-IB / isolate 7/3/14) TaxID=1108050 RepID=A0A0B7FQJ9_THACB|nr:Extracellular metalloprotease 1 OS=Coccidioides posadasii (strain C735) GN=MEP1 PE=1 SV=1 [Rhizoctonia solani AG-1 IB]
MLPLAFLSFGLSLTVVWAGNQTRICASTPSDEYVASAEAHFLANKPWSKSTASFKREATIEVHWHVIQSGNALNQGNIPDSQISASITALNQHYSGSGITFNLIDTDRTTNSDWFSRSSIGSTQQTEMKAALRQGSAATLNIYTTGNTLSQGYATFPSDYTKNPVDDGVVVLYSTLPGGSFAPFNEGKTLTHEVGHWLGLYHTFQGGCSNPGDFVDDTPPQARPSSGCPIGQDTCPGGGVDP